MKYRLIIFAILSFLGVNAQNYNLDSIGHLDYTVDVNDIWAYEDSNGDEYALVGLENGLSIVSLVDPSNPSELHFVPGKNSFWRDIKTWGDYAYVTTEASDGLLIVDLSALPQNITYSHWIPELDVNGDVDSLLTIHNLYIDEQGYAHLAGTNLNNGEILIVDVHSDPIHPSYVGAAGTSYSHDAYARGDTLWTSDVYDGVFSAYDVSNRSNPLLLGQNSTPSYFSHNAWISNDGETLFTTDEKEDAWITAYDVSDLSNIEELDRWRTLDRDGVSGVIPHNVHVHNDFLVISYYTDGLVILDASRPHNLVEVAHYDTYTGPGAGFNGAWGAYPFLSSGNILVSDINSGLFVLSPSYSQAAWLEGLVTDQETGLPIYGAEIELENTSISATSDLGGNYATGISETGTYTIEFSEPRYETKTIQVSLQSGQVNIQNISLEPLPRFLVRGRVVEAEDPNTGIEDAIVVFSSDLYQYTTETNADGYYEVNDFYESDYEIKIGKWGYHAQDLGEIQIDSTNNEISTTALIKGYRDDFFIDYSWLVESAAASGIWERGIPEEVFNYQGVRVVPNTDLSNDLGDFGYFTGLNDNQSYAEDDVDGGYTKLLSPIFDVSTYSDPYLSYHYWFVDEEVGLGSPNDSLWVELSNGSDNVTIALYQSSNYEWSSKEHFRIRDYINPTSTMQISFYTSDYSPSYHVLEAGIDFFEVTDGQSLGITTKSENEPAVFTCSPNPFTYELDLSYYLSKTMRLSVYNAMGKQIHNAFIESGEGRLNIGVDWPSGIYFLQIGEQTRAVIKH